MFAAFALRKRQTHPVNGPLGDLLIAKAGVFYVVTLHGSTVSTEFNHATRTIFVDRLSARSFNLFQHVTTTNSYSVS